MDENEIANKALVVPDDNSEYEDSGPDDLGRYGLGLKQGTFAHCKSLTILSKILLLFIMATFSTWSL